MPQNLWPGKGVGAQGQVHVQAGISILQGVSLSQRSIAGVKCDVEQHPAVLAAVCILCRQQ